MERWSRWREARRVKKASSLSDICKLKNPVIQFTYMHTRDHSCYTCGYEFTHYFHIHESQHCPNCKLFEKETS